MPTSEAACREMSAGAAPTPESFRRCGWQRRCLTTEAVMHKNDIPGFEVERYELHAGPTYRFVPDRRDFVKLLGGGLVVLLALNAEAQESGGAGRRGGGRGGQAMPQEIGAW